MINFDFSTVNTEAFYIYRLCLAVKADLQCFSLFPLPVVIVHINNNELTRSLWLLFLLLDVNDVIDGGRPQHGHLTQLTRPQTGGVHVVNHDLQDFVSGLILMQFINE